MLPLLRDRRRSRGSAPRRRRLGAPGDLGVPAGYEIPLRPRPRLRHRPCPHRTRLRPQAPRRDRARPDDAARLVALLTNGQAPRRGDEDSGRNRKRQKAGVPPQGRPPELQIVPIPLARRRNGRLHPIPHRLPKMRSAFLPGRRNRSRLSDVEPRPARGRSLLVPVSRYSQRKGHDRGRGDRSERLRRRLQRGTARTPRAGRERDFSLADGSSPFSLSRLPLCRPLLGDRRPLGRCAGGLLRRKRPRGGRAAGVFQDRRRHGHPLAQARRTLSVPALRAGRRRGIPGRHGKHNLHHSDGRLPSIG